MCAAILSAAGYEDKLICTRALYYKPLHVGFLIFICKRSGKYPDDTRDCDAAFDVVLSPYKKILSLARIMYKRSPHSDVTPTAGILLDMCKAKWEAEYLGPPPGCKKGQRCDFTPILRDCQENMFIAMKKLHHEECDDPRDTNYDC